MTPTPANAYDPNVDPTDCWFCVLGSKGSGFRLMGGGEGSWFGSSLVTATALLRFRGSRTMVLPRDVNTAAERRIMIPEDKRSVSRVQPLSFLLFNVQDELAFVKPPVSRN